MSTSPFLPNSPPPFGHLADKQRAADDFASAIYIGVDALRRASDGFDAIECEHQDAIYSDRQLLLALKSVERARVALETMRRFTMKEFQKQPEPPAEEPLRGRPSFPSEQKPKGGA